MQRSAFLSNGVAVILNPYRPYAFMLMERLYKNHGIRTVCLHTRWRERLTLEGRYPILRSPAVAAHYMVARGQWQGVARHLARRHRIVAVLPYEEGVVHPMAVVAQTLGLSWAQPSVLPAFRDKYALKSLVARADPSVRLNQFAQVRSAGEVLRLAQESGVQRYVLKPNSGSGNEHVAFFATTTDQEQVHRYFQRVVGPVLFEEFIEGPEFWVNGQMDADGHPTVVGMGEYYRTASNGIENLEVGTMSLQPDDPRFAPLARYAESVMRATGLRRSPFHLEAIIDDRGPCLIEVGARFCGELGTLIDMEHHGPTLDLIEVAAHYYISDRPLGPLPLNWPNVARSWVATATGDSAFDQRLVEVSGIDHIEASGRHLFWINRPLPGDHVQRTTSLTTRAWAVALRGHLGEDPRSVIDWARATVCLRGTASRKWRTRQKLPMYKNLMRKAVASRPRPYEVKAVLHPLR
jgi:hypothetical protein